MTRKKLKEFKSQATKMIKLLGTIEDMNLTPKEKEEFINTYDTLTIHGSISLEALSSK